MNRSSKGIVWAPILIGLALVGTVLFVTKPKALDGDSKRADKSTATTQQLVDSGKAREAQAAASLAVIGQANAHAPDSLEKQFIAREVPLALTFLAPPDPKALIEAGKRREAVLAGKLELATQLYQGALDTSAKAQRALDRALAAKRASDLALQQEASERLGAERVRNRCIAVAVVAILLWLYVKLTHLSPGALATAVADIRQNNTPPITALDGVTTRLQQGFVRFLAKLKHEPTTHT